MRKTVKIQVRKWTSKKTKETRHLYYVNLSTETIDKLKRAGVLIGKVELLPDVQNLDKGIAIVLYIKKSKPQEQI